MNIEELEKEADEYTKKDCPDNFLCTRSIARRAYLAGAKPREKQIEIDAEQIRALQKQNGELTDKVKELEDRLCNVANNLLDNWCRNEEDYCPHLAKLEKENENLKAQIEKMKSQYDYAFNQLRESREIVCLMLSQYKNKKEIDYSTKERGEKLLKQGVYKYD